MGSKLPFESGSNKATPGGGSCESRHCVSAMGKRLSSPRPERPRMTCRSSDLPRRQWIAQLGTGLLAAGILPRDALPVRRGQTRPLIMDAMGEIRLTHEIPLIREVLASGTTAVMVTLTDPKPAGPEAFDLALDDLLAYDHHIAAHPDVFLKATRAADADRALREGKLALYYMLQNAAPLQDRLNRIDVLHALGVRALQLTYNHQNLLGAGCRERGDNGLTELGREAIARMNAIGMLVDTSHANMRTMRGAVAASTRPTIVSHTACVAVHPHIRNTTDENLRAVADGGGVIGICQIRPFLTDQKRNNLAAYFEHLDHAVQVAGVEHVCIGSDRDHRRIPDTPEELEQLKREEGAQFSDADWPLFLEALNGPRRMEVVRDELGRRGYRAADAEKILGQNLRRAYRDAIG